jgi:hypothetical protein
MSDDWPAVLAVAAALHAQPKTATATTPPTVRLRAVFVIAFLQADG